MKRDLSDSKWVFFCTFLGILLLSASVKSGQVSAVQEPPPLRTAEPVAIVIDDLENYIPGRMQELGVPGVSVALIRDHTIAWTAGFGVVNTLTRVPVTPDTVFEVASNGKPVAAYIALQYVSQGWLALDEPVINYLTTPWLPRSDSADTITMRHLLTHSSGLSNAMLLRSKRLAFSPGEKFCYSGIGFMYLQALLEQRIAQLSADHQAVSIENIAHDRVFKPLGMNSSSYISSPDIHLRTANGHVSYVIPVAVWTAFWLVLSSLFFLADSLFLYLCRRQWSFKYRRVLYLVGFAWVSLCLIIGFILGWNFSGLAVVLGLMLSLIWGLLFFSGRWFLPRGLGTVNGPTGWKLMWLSVSFLLSLTLLLGISAAVSGPLPNLYIRQPNVAYTLRSTASDMARFLIEMAAPQHIDTQLATQSRSPQISVIPDISWGLGIGIQQSAEGDALWHWGSNTGYKSLLVIYPERGLGIVILTNGDRGLPLARDIAQRALGGEAYWSIYGAGP
ncbi:MAG: beta-lactamase family protein [Anaerolineae bacterium]|nr:beta-lactamase family protein [Anaerolineae bacterium]